MGKLKVKNLVIRASDDVTGELLFSFICEFLDLKWKSGWEIEEKDYILIDSIRRVYNKEYVYYYMLDGKLEYDIVEGREEEYTEDDLMDEVIDNNWLYYDSVKDFLKRKEEWLIES